MEASRKVDESRLDANYLIAGGASAAAIGAAGAFIAGAVCPLCIVATPLLLGAGLLKRMKLSRDRKQGTEGKEEDVDE